ncbi:MAG: PAAR domain-containing protein [Candidatus Competibacteraceae bacterium]
MGESDRPPGGGTPSNLRLAVNQHISGVTGDRTSPWTRATDTPRAMLSVGANWAHSVGQARDAWANIRSPATPGGPPPTAGQAAARTLRATQQTVGMIMGGLGLVKDALDAGFANLTAPIASVFPSLPAATLLSPYLGTPHAHPAHPPSGPPPLPPTPLPSIGMVLLGVTPRVLINYLPAARCDDIGLAPTCCGIPPAWFKIKTGSSNVFIGGSRAARLGDICQACKNIPEPPSLSAGKAMAAIGKAAGAASHAMVVGGIVAGGIGMAADVAEAAVEDDDAMAAAKALSAAMAAAQMAADATKMAVEATMWKDPTLPPTGSIGAIIDPSHATVLIGGFPMANIPNPVNAILNRLQRYKVKRSAETNGVGPPGCP